MVPGWVSATAAAVSVFLGVMVSIELIENNYRENDMRPRAEAAFLQHFGLDRPEVYVNIARPVSEAFFTADQFVKTCTTCFHERVMDNVERVYAMIGSTSVRHYARIYLECPPTIACSESPRAGLLMAEVTEAEALGSARELRSSTQCDEQAIDGRLGKFCHLALRVGDEIVGESFEIALPSPRFAIFVGSLHDLIRGWINFDYTTGTCVASELPSIAAWLEAQGCTFHPVYPGVV